MIRLRQSLDSTLRHPLVGPLLLLFLCVVLAFVVIHAIEHGVVGELFTCGMLAAFALRLVAMLNRRQPDRRELSGLAGRAPPRDPQHASCSTVAAFQFALPLRR